MEYLKPKVGTLPKYVPDHEWLIMEDVRHGPFCIWVNMKGTVFVDIDGTVADLAHRRKFIAVQPKDYPAFEKGIPDDLPIHWVINAVARLFDAGWKVVMCTGRRETHREATEKWLAEHGVRYHAFYIRAEYEYNVDGTVKKTRKGKPKPDHRHDYIVKAELLAQARADGFDPDVVFDDRNQVVEMWRANGIPVVQTAEGDF